MHTKLRTLKLFRQKRRIVIGRRKKELEIERELKTIEEKHGSKENIPNLLLKQAFEENEIETIKVLLNAGGNIKTASINMTDNVVSSGSTFVTGTDTSLKSFRVQSGPSFIQNNAAQSNIFNIGTHTIQTGEKVRLLSDNGDFVKADDCVCDWS